jgi:Uma2 family endonuclease
MSPTDVAQPDILFVSNARSHIVTEANIQGAPDLVVEILSPGTASYDRGYKRTLYSRHGVLEYWLVDPEAETVEVLTPNEAGLTMAATLRRSDTLTSPLLAGLAIDLEQVFR